MTRIYQMSRAQEWALIELRDHGRVSQLTTRLMTLRTLERAGLIVREETEWMLTPTGEREADRARARLRRRSSS